MDFEETGALDTGLAGYARLLCRKRLTAYRAAPHDVEEHANIELSVLAGGYAYRQIAELVQNAADAVADAPDSPAGRRIVINIDEAGLWAANTGAPVDSAGVRALLSAHASGKRAGQIGRFGLGFKSLLRLGGRIDVLSRSVGLRFDPEGCRAQIRASLGLGPDAPAPGLRLAESCTWQEGVMRTSGSARFSWATTIIFAELRELGAREAVIEEMRRFPAEFLLFLPGDVELILTGEKVARHLRRCTDPDGSVTIEDLVSGTTQTWRVFQTNVKITDPTALADATNVHARDAVPLVWAAPIGTGREVAGRFFAFFPTATETRTLGILNAPWKLNSDRTSVIPGAWNAALMEAAAALIVDKLAELVNAEDPGVVLDAFPRELQHLNEPAAPLVHALWSRLANAPVLPNCDGALMLPAACRRAPHDSPQLIREWSRLAPPEECAMHLHASCTSSPARVSRLNQLAERLGSGGSGTDAGPGLARTTALEWLALAAAPEPETAIEALELADAWAHTCAGYEWDQIRDRVPLILATDGSLLSAAEITFQDPADPPLKSIHPILRSSVEAIRILHERFRVTADTASDWSRLLNARLAAIETEDNWNQVWALLRRIPRQRVAETVEDCTIMVRSLAGWVSSDDAFHAGSLVQFSDLEALSEEEAAHLKLWLIDETFHERDGAILNALGVGDAPSWNWTYVSSGRLSGPAGQWLQRRWLNDCTSRYWERLSYRPERSLLGPAAFEMPKGWDLLLLTHGNPRKRVTDALLRCVRSEPQQLSTVAFRHISRPRAWLSAEYPHPLWLLLLERGDLAFGDRSISVQSLLIGEIEERAQILPSLAGWTKALACLQRAGAGQSTSRDPSEVWSDWLEFAAGEVVEAGELRTLYEQAAHDGVAPRRICSLAGPVDLSEVLLAPSTRDACSAQAAGLNAICLNSTAADLWLRRGARTLASESSIDWTPSRVEAGGVLLREMEPVLEEALRPQFRAAAGVVFASVITRRIRETRSQLSWVVHDGRLLISELDFLGLGWPERVCLLLEGAAACGWTEPEISFDRLMSSGIEARRRAVASEATLPDRLLRAVGDARVICSLFDADIASELIAHPRRAAEVALRLLGPALLAEPAIQEALQREGLGPPERWGGEGANEFVAAVGFPPEFAASPTRRREPELLVAGPVTLKPLHDYQERVVASLEALLNTPLTKRRRAVISLPTGAGKTRVAAQTVVTRILAADESPNRLVVWIAQTDELCEQAVQCFRELWANLGERGTTLRVIRLWGGQANPQPPERGEPTVVVASIQTLSSRLTAAPLEWINRPAAVVIDECHHALTPSYTGLLKWLGKQGQEPPMIGLSATPFRGRNEEETRQLASRFDGRLLPANQAGLFDDLQTQGVLARFAYTRLEMERRFDLTPEEERHMETFNKLPDSALERLGLDQERNDRILSAITQAAEGSALVFATSVAHARRLAAHLNVRGVPASVVSGETDRNSRRWFIEAFRKGDVRVLCNHSALTTGFDAPATDLIVIARPVFSPSLYMQMVGRGLRGPKNGGKPQCRILTVQDNLERYSGELAHHYFEKYYLPGAADMAEGLAEGSDTGVLQSHLA